MNLTKGGNVNLSQQAQGLTAVSVGLGWDVSAFGGGIDIDASALVIAASGRILSDQHFVFFNNLSSPDGAVQHAGDNSTGAGAGDDEQILVDLNRLGPEADRIAFAVSIHDGGPKGQNFGQVRNAYIRVANRADGREIARYDLSQQAYSETAMIFGELYRHGGDWKFRAVGQGFADGLAGIARSFGLTV
ncbi:TerD family protein [Antrihabitans sp. YC2-6]|uniref:TerD family protein n=1 Tax=Antrihabitans sp. YC2-6 TaxID=2799498 RepID=UPI0027DD0990|nr:TerD family protein [Antrihabitans sp. YC2-6]